MPPRGAPDPERSRRNAPTIIVHPRSQCQRKALHAAAHAAPLGTSAPGRHPPGPASPQEGDERPGRERQLQTLHAHPHTRGPCGKAVDNVDSRTPPTTFSSLSRASGSPPRAPRDCLPDACSRALPARPIGPSFRVSPRRLSTTLVENLWVSCRHEVDKFPVCAGRTAFVRSRIPATHSL